MNLEIQKLSSKDFELAKLLFLFFQVDNGSENPTKVSNEYMKEMLSRNDFHVLVARSGESILGGLTAYELKKYKNETTEMFLYEIGVEEVHRRKGVAAKLIDGLKQICRQKGISEIFVITEMDNEPAKKLYEKSGGEFEETAIYTYQVE